MLQILTYVLIAAVWASYKYVPNGRPHDMSKGSGVPSSASTSNGTGSQGSEMLSSMLAAASPDQQKQILGEHLYPPSSRKTR